MEEQLTVNMKKSYATQYSRIRIRSKSREWIDTRFSVSTLQSGKQRAAAIRL